MPKRENEMFIGLEKLNIQGRAIKHPALIRTYATATAKKIAKEPIPVIGMDIETNHLTGEPRLFGFYKNDFGYRAYTAYNDNLVGIMFSYIRFCNSENLSLAYWNRLDPFVIFRLLLKEVDKKRQDRALKHFSKIGGEWHRKSGKWIVEPVVEVEYYDYKFGIKNAIRSCIEFFYYRKGSKELKTVWAYDIAQLYPSGLEKEASTRLEYYSKVDKSAHLVDWDRFKREKDYRDNIVLKSNELDSRAVHDLAYIIQLDFKNAFGFYPKSLVSQGSFARSAIVAEIHRELKSKYKDEKKLFASILKEIQSIGLINYKDKWAKEYGKEFYKDMESLFTEAYSGGYIEAIRYGYADKGYYADIASAYPAIIKDLYDLRGAKIVHGQGVPTPLPYSYVFMRGVVDIPAEVQFHTVTVKHWLNKETNIRPVGTFRASYTYEEREFLLSQGATFKDEHYYMIITQGKLSPLAKVCLKFIELRKQLKEQGSSSEHMAKIAVNSIYGILFEAVDTYEQIAKEKMVVLEKFRDDTLKELLNHYKKRLNLEPIESDLKSIYDKEYRNIKTKWHSKDGISLEDLKNELSEKGLHLENDHPADIMNELLELYELNNIISREESQIIDDVIRAGYRAGEFWNPLYASIITSRTRLLMAKGAKAIEESGGKVILLMTDSILWQGSADMLPKEYVRDIKTLGYFEKPEAVKDIVCLGSGRYGYTNKYGTYTAKKRGLNVTDIHSPDGVPLDDFNWANALTIMQKTGKTDIQVNVRTLVSAGLVVHNHSYSVDDLGRVVTDTKVVPAVVGKNKRYYDSSIQDPHKLATTLVDTRSIEINPYMFGKYEILDQTLPILRTEYMKKPLILHKEKKKKNYQRYYKKNHMEIKEQYRKKYAYLKEIGYSTKEAKYLAGLKTETLKTKLSKDGHEIKEDLEC